MLNFQNNARECSTIFLKRSTNASQDFSKNSTLLQIIAENIRKLLQIYPEQNKLLHVTWKQICAKIMQNLSRFIHV